MRVNVRISLLSLKIAILSMLAKYLLQFQPKIYGGNATKETMAIFIRNAIMLRTCLSQETQFIYVYIFIILIPNCLVC